MATPFDSFGYVDATQTVARAARMSEIAGVTFGAIGTGKADSSPRPMAGVTSAAAIRRMIDGDHWLDGTGWIGPRPGPLDDGAAEVLALIHSAFISENALADVIDRHIAGVLGREPTLGFAVRRHLKPDEEPTPGEQDLIADAEATVTEWWDARKVHAIMQGYVRTLLAARRAPARLYVPRGKLVARNETDPESGRAVRTVREVPNAVDVSAGLNFVWPDAPLPENACVAVDEDTKESIGVVLYQGGQNVQGTNPGARRAECVFVNDRGKTVIRQLDDASAPGARPGGAATLDFGGRLTMYEAQRSRFVTPQMIQLQRGINLTLTAVGRNVVTAGWLERIIANAQTPKGWVKDATGKLVLAEGGPAKHVTGGGVTLYLTGIKQKEESTGKETLATPTVTFREPGQASPLIETLEALFRGILREAKQEHVQLSNDVQSSGKAREQARADFEMTLRATAAEINALGRWLIETALAMAEAFAGTPGKYTNELRSTFECAIDTGPVTAEERTANDASVTAGTLSREAGMAANGVADVGATIAQMAADPLNQLEIGLKRAQMLAALTTAGADLVGAAILVGFTPEEARALVPQFTTGPAAPGANNPDAANNPGTENKTGDKPPTDTPPADAGQGTGGNGGASGAS